MLTLLSPADATVSLNMATYTGTEGDPAFGDVCAVAMLSGAGGSFEADLVVTLGTSDGSAGQNL